MKKKRFYNNKKRNKKWTEQEQGRKIYFADKYIDNANADDAYDGKRRKDKKPFFTAERMTGIAKWFVIITACVLIINIGYTVMDVYIDRNAMPLVEEEDNGENHIGNIALRIKGCDAQPLTMDNGVLLSSVIDSVQSDGYTAVSIDAKRDDGTIGYVSQLAVLDMYGAQSSPASDIKGSVERLLANDILPVARISCYKDNVFAKAYSSAAVKYNGEIYEDAHANSYLNPDDENVYNYIKGIVEELKSMGVSVFVLDNCDLPSEIAEGKNDGFEALSNRLTDDLGDDIKLLKGVSVTIDFDSENQSKAEKEIDEKIVSVNDGDVLFYITSGDNKAVKSLLDGRENINYIITE